MEKKKLLLIVVPIVVAIIIAVCILIVINNSKKAVFTISFDTNSDIRIGSQFVNEGEKVIKPSDPTREGYIFLGWTLNGQDYNFDTIIEGNLQLEAKWEKEIIEDLEEDNTTEKTYTVVFNSDGGSSIESQIITAGNKVTKPNAPTRNGYIFKGWILNNQEYDFDIIVESDLELKAKWEEVVNNQANNSNSNNNSQTNNNNNNNNNNTQPAEKKYTVTFDSNGGSSVATQTITEGSKVTRPSDPTRNGYTFAGWRLNGNNYDFNTTITGNITLVAQWNEVIKNKYTVTFNSNGGSSVGNQTIEEGNKATRPSDPTRSGYTFAGWTLNGSNYDFNSAVTGNITLVAKWNQKSYTISARKVDDYSTDRILTVYENGSAISIQSIKYTNGVLLCNGSNTTVFYGDIEGITNYIVVLSDGTQVTATMN